VTDVHAVFGSAIAETITADPAWPGLVAAVAAANPDRWTPATYYRWPPSISPTPTATTRSHPPTTRG
jgi:hypothetical protein